jgi:hypothetical protein
MLVNTTILCCGQFVKVIHTSEYVMSFNIEICVKMGLLAVFSVIRYNVLLF